MRCTPVRVSRRLCIGFGDPFCDRARCRKRPQQELKGHRPPGAEPARPCSPQAAGRLITGRFFLKQQWQPRQQKHRSERLSTRQIAICSLCWARLASPSTRTGLWCSAIAPFAGSRQSPIHDLRREPREGRFRSARRQSRRPATDRRYSGGLGAC